MEVVKRTAYDKLRQLLVDSEQSQYSWVNSGKHTEWRRGVEAALRRLFGETSEHLKAFRDVHYSPMMFTDGTPDSVWVNCFRDGMTSARAIVRAVIQEVEDYGLGEEQLAGATPSVKTVRRVAVVPDSTRVFVVHGHDTEMKEAVARFIERLNLEAVILGEQASGGDTIIEKFERCVDVAFAIILLSGDDVGAPASEAEHLKPRARQNAILELGYFLGILGRQRVCPLVRGRIDLPSDMHGVVYVPFDGDGWKIQLVKELKQAGFSIDANQTF
jgi:predicted nucleotide-binding protein